MIYIKKGKEPASLTKYKKQKFAYYDGYKEKDDLRKMHGQYKTIDKKY